MTINHTPTPWHVSGLRNVCANATQGGALTGALQDHVALAATGEDAAHIVRCVNAHDELIAALELCLFAVTSDADANEGRVDRIAVAQNCRAAIARAKGI